MSSQAIREILILHHSHTDIGYTHSQPVAWRLHARFIDQAIDVGEATADWPEEARMKWTCEITAPVLYWLKTASPKQRERFRNLVARGQLAISGMPYNICPLMESIQLIQGLQPVRQLREELGAPIRTAINHDVNGLPWPLVGYLKDAGIDLLIMGLNIQFGASPFPRPRPFRWEGPDGRNILVWHGEHYDAVGRLFRPDPESTEIKTDAWMKYEKRLLAGGYPFDFAIITATHMDWCDNNPPNPNLPELVRRWNAETGGPKMRIVTPEQILERLQLLPEKSVPVRRGDWTDYWNFGSASTGVATRINRQSKVRLRTAELLRGASLNPARDFRETVTEAWQSVNFFDEHTWGHYASISDPTRDDVLDGAIHKDIASFEGRSLSLWALREQLEVAAGNPSHATGAGGVLVVNPTANPRSEYLKLPLFLQRKDLPHTISRVHVMDEALTAASRNDPCFVLGPIAMAPYESRFLSIADWPIAPETHPACEVGDGWISSPYYRLEFSNATGRVTRCHDLKLGRELLDAGAEWDFFGFVRESVDTEVQKGERPEMGGRDVLFKVDYVDIFEGRSGWNREWPALREKASDDCKWEVLTKPEGVTLRRSWANVPGATDLVQEITLFGDSPEISCLAEFWKTDVRSAESVYFTFPLELSNWRAHFDTADFPVELEHEQLGACSQDYVTVGNWACVHSDDAAVTLACPDAPMVQIGGFRFGRFTPAAREKNCLLLAWPINNYWDTNFRVNQPGFHRYRYNLTSTASYDPVSASSFGEKSRVPVEIHTVTGASPNLPSGPLLYIDNPALRILAVQESGRHANHWVVRLMNVTQDHQSASLNFPQWKTINAVRCDSLEEPGARCESEDGWLSIQAGPGETVGLIISL